MLSRTPGFVLDEGARVRGLAGGSGNVLIDGRRPSAKADGLSDALKQIPAAHVERIEIVRGAQSNELSGQTIVANIVRRADAKGSGSVAVTLERAPQGRVFPNLEANYSAPIGAWQASVSGTFMLEYHPIEGLYRLTDGSGDLVGTRRETIGERYRQETLSGALAGPVAGGTLALNGRYDRRNVRETQALTSFAGEPASTPGSTSDLTIRDRISRTELGGDWSRRLGRDWSMKVTGFFGAETADQDQDRDGRNLLPGESFAERLRSRQTSREVIGRAVLSRQGTHALLPEVGFEIAENRLDSRLTGAVTTDGVEMPLMLPAADVRVRELRGEAFATLRATVAKAWTLEGGMALERSRISVTGDAENHRTLTFWKPSVAMLWNPGPDTQVRLGLRRTVGQLEFTDFAASVVAIDNRPLGGNPDLRPAQETKLSLGIDKRHSNDGAVSIELYHSWHRNLLEYILLDDGTQALGNIARGRSWGATAKITQPLEFLLEGARLQIDGEVRMTRLDDPVTGRSRRFNNTIPHELTIAIRHDIKDWRAAWGIEYTAANTAYFYYSDELMADRLEPVWEAFAEKTFGATKLKVSIYGLGDERFSRNRSFYTPSLDGTLASTESRSRERGGAYVIATASRQF